MKKILYIAVLFFLVFGAMTLQNSKEQKIKKIVTDEKNATYIIDGKPTTLKDGFSEVADKNGGNMKIVTKYFGNKVSHDLNDDGLEDVAFLLTQETGGSGTFFYLVGALNTSEGYIGSHAFYLGDRIAPQTTNINEGSTSRETNRKNVIVVNFAERLPEEPFTTQPSIGKSVWVKLDPITMQWGVVASDFEGESR